MRTMREIRERDLILSVLDQIVRANIGKNWTLEKHMKLKRKYLNIIDTAYEVAQ